MSQKVVIGVTDLSFHRVAASLVANTLINMGFEVERIYSHHEKNFQRLQSGEIDMLTSAWLPSSHGVYKHNVEKSVSLIELGFHYQPYALWGVPDYIPDDVVAEVSDLLKPQVLEKMSKTIQGINAGAGISRFSAAIIEQYGLGEHGYSFLTGTEEDCFGAYEKAVAKNEWIVVPLWRPQFLHSKYTIRELKEPMGLLGGMDKAVLLLREDRQSLFSKTQIDVLNSLRFTNKIIEILDYQVCREGRNLDETTKKWMESNSI